MWTENKGILFLILLMGLSGLACAQNKFTIQPEILIGHIVPNFPDYPPSSLLYGAGISLSTKQPKGLWKKYYPKSQTGFFVGAWNMGNDSIFGREITAYPYIEFPIGNRKKSTLSIRVGLGAAYFSKYHSEKNNIHNNAVGSPVTWAFEGSLNWAKPINDHLDFTLSGKFLHGSNGHVQLPNFGINSGALGIGLRIHPNRNEADIGLLMEKTRSKNIFLQIRSGVGVHEFGDAKGPVGGPKYGIQFFATYANILYNQRNKLKLGFTFRHYNSYQNYITEYNLKELNASSFSFVLGHEFLLGHVGLDVDGLLHLYKPFFRTYYDKYGEDSQFLYFMHRWLGARVGFNFYLYPQASLPEHNLFLGVHLNTNNGEADFSSIGIGYIHLLR